MISNTADYDPQFYDKTDSTTYIMGSARLAFQQAMEAGGGEVVFDTTADLDPGNGTSYFGGPINEFNTINLEYGEISIKDEGYFNADPLPRSTPGEASQGVAV